MTDYNSASHQQMYDFVHSGSPSTVQNEADLNTSHGKSVTTATSDLQKTLTKIQSAWEGAAADQFSQQANSIVNQMNQHATNADNIGQVMTYVSKTLKWSQDNMPSPPSAAEQALADVNSNPISEWGLGIATGGTSYVASKAAQDDIAQKKGVATQVMTQLASAYTQAQSQLTANEQHAGTTDPTGPGNNNGNGKGDQSGTGNGSSSGGSSGGASGGVMMPMPIAIPASTGTTEGSGSSPRLSYGSPVGSVTGTPTGPTGSVNTGTGNISNPVTSGTVTSGLGDLPTTGTLTGGTGTGTGSLNGGLGGTGGLGGLGGGTGTGGVGGLGGLGGGLGAGGLGAGGLGAGGLGAGGLGGAGGAGEGSLGGYGSGSKSALSGGTGTGEMGGEEAGGTGYGSKGATSSGSGAGTSAAAAAGEEGAAGAGGATNEQGMMGGMGRGGAGGGKEERGGRATWLKEDPDYWYGDKMKNAAPPGGVIE